MSFCLTRNRIWFVTWDRNLVAFILLVEHAVVILAYQFLWLTPLWIYQLCDSRFTLESRHEVSWLSFSFLDCFVRIGFRVFCYIRVKRNIISHVETSFSIACIKYSEFRPWRVSPTSFRPEREWFCPEVEVTYQKETFPSCKKSHLSIEFEEKKVYAQNESCSVMPWKRDLSWEHVETNKLSPRAERKV